MKFRTKLLKDRSRSITSGIELNKRPLWRCITHQVENQVWMCSVKMSPAVDRCNGQAKAQVVGEKLNQMRLVHNSKPRWFPGHQKVQLNTTKIVLQAKWTKLSKIVHNLTSVIMKAMNVEGKTQTTSKTMSKGNTEVFSMIVPLNTNSSSKTHTMVVRKRAITSVNSLAWILGQLLESARSSCMRHQVDVHLSNSTETDLK